MDNTNKTKYIKLQEMNPYIRICSKHKILGGFNTGLRINPHYQLHYICAGEGIFSISNMLYKVSKGDLLLWIPGEEHVLESDLDKPLTVIGIQFDFTQNFSNHIYPLIHYNQENFETNYINEIVEFIDAPFIPTYTKLHQAAIKEFYLESIVHTYSEQGPFFNEKVSGLLKCLLVEMLQEESLHKLQHNRKDQNIQDIIDYLQIHYNENLSNSYLGKLFGFHPNYLNHMISEYTSMPLQQYLTHIRMNKAMILLQHTNKSVGEIAGEVGYNSVHYFSRHFKEKIGVSPSKFK